MTPETSRFTSQEGTALLFEIFPKYPDLRGVLPVPSDLEKWLADYRAKQESA